MLCFLREGRDIVRLESLPRLRVYRLLGIKKTGSIHTLSGIKKQKLVPTGAFRSVTGSSAAFRGRFCDFCIPIVLPHGAAPFSGSVRQDDRNATFSAARLSDLLHRSYLLLAAISGFIAVCNAVQT